MNHSQHVRKRKSKGRNSLQISKQRLIQGVDQRTTAQDDLREDDISRYLNLTNQPYERENSWEMEEDPPAIKTKKNHLIIQKKNQEFQCGICSTVFKKSQGLGGHCQKAHRQYQDKSQSIRKVTLRERHAQTKKNRF